MTDKGKNRLQRFQKQAYAFGGIALLALLVKLFSFSRSVPKEDERFQQYFNEHYKVFGINLPKDLNFAGEQVPLNDFSVREALDRELLLNTYWQSQTLLIHKKANRWFPIIEPILKKYGIPEDFKYIPIVESGFSNVVSPAKATGFWQFIENTALNYGLEINEEVDERYHVEKATEAACKYFKEAYKTFNNWTLVAASYNLGMGGISSQLERQKASSYYNLLLNEETGRYVYRLLAIKEIISRPKSYGFMLRKKDFYPSIPFDKITVDSTITDIADFAIKQGYDYKTIKYFNPWLRKNTLTNKDHKIYTLYLPKKEFLSSIYFDDFYEKKQPEGSLTNDSTKVFNVQDLLSDSTKTSFKHTVKEGETVSLIAELYKTNKENILKWNSLSSEKLELLTNQELIIYSGIQN